MRDRDVSEEKRRGCRQRTREILDLIDTEDDPGCCCNRCCTSVKVYSILSGLATLVGVMVEILKNSKFTDKNGNRIWYPSPYPSPLALHILSIVLGVIFGIEVLVRFIVAQSYFLDESERCTGTNAVARRQHHTQSSSHRSVNQLPFFRNPFNWFDILSIPPLNTGFFRILRVFRLSSRWDASVIVYETMHKSGRPIAEVD